MIVLGADTHKRSHTIAAVAAATGELLGEQTVAVGEHGFGILLQWARGLDQERVWALEDCRHVSGSLERFLIERGERVLRIPTHLTAKARKSARQRGKSDPIGELTGAINQLEREITVLVGQIAPQLLAEPGFGPLIAAKLVGEIAGAQRFATAAKLARAAGVAPIPASSGNTQRHRLDH